MFTGGNEWLPRRKEMMHENRDNKFTTTNRSGAMVGMLVGGLAGAVTMLLLAPQSGKDTRRQIQKKGLELRDRTSEVVEDTLAQVRTSTNKLGLHVKTYGQKLAAEQLDDASEAIEAGKKAIDRS
jgi:gas vesicle protein